jgi:DnaA family protein
MREQAGVSESTSRSTSAQLPLALRFPPDQRFETFVAAPDGALAQLRALARGEGASVYVAGAAATGKSHLLLAACAEAEQAGRRVAYLPMAAAAGRLRDALDALEQADLVALDGLDIAAGNRDDEIALFDAHNRAHDAGRRMLYAARAMPDALPLTLPDLRSRLSQCARIALEPLDDAGRADVLRLRAQRRGLQLDDAAIDWLLKRVDRDLVTLTVLLDRLDRESLAAQRRLTVPFLRQVLGG